MLIREALNVRHGDVIAFIGAGGKTTSLFRLARELTADGMRVITTTTTKMAQDELLRAPVSLQATGKEMDSIRAELESNRHVLIYSGLSRGKALGIPPEEVDRLIEDGVADVILVEADGARRLPFKAPYEYEPVIPNSTTVVVSVIGLNALGLSLTDENVYNARQIAEELSIRYGDPVTPQLIATTMRHERLLLHGIPPKARVMAFLNQADNEELRDVAREIAGKALRGPRYDAVAICQMRADDPVLEVRRRVEAIILAAGKSARMEGRNKLLLPWGEGKTILTHVVATVSSTDVVRVVVVAGLMHDEIENLLYDMGGPITVVQNPYRDGDMLSSLQVGIRMLRPNTAACLAVLADQPRIDAPVMRAVLDLYAKTGNTIVMPSYKGQAGHPVLIDRALWTELMAIPGHLTPRVIMDMHRDEVAYVEVQSDSVISDIDTWDDYERELKKAGLL